MDATAGAYAEGHIPDAINLPHREISAGTTDSLDRSKVYVCYCDGIGCNASTKTALKLATLGFQVRELIGGLDWWKRDGYPVHHLSGALAGCRNGVRLQLSRTPFRPPAELANRVRRCDGAGGVRALPRTSGRV